MSRIYQDKHRLKVEDLEIELYEMDGQVIASCKLLELVTCGKNFDDACEKFDDACKLYLRYLKYKGKLDLALQELGWEKTKKQYNSPIQLGTRKIQVSIPA